jgi:hypothetical protein
VKKKDFLDQTPLHWAAREGKTKMVRLLLERWPEGVKEKDRGGSIPLQLAVQVANVDMVRLFVESWPEGKEALNEVGLTPLSAFEHTPPEPKRLDQTKTRAIISLLGGVY